MSKARQAIPTVTFVDEYCQLYQDLFPDVRSFEHFKFLHVGMLSEIKRKTLPAIAKVAGDLDPLFWLLGSSVQTIWRFGSLISHSKQRSH
jgi:SRSO17 transposase